MPRPSPSEVTAQQEQAVARVIGHLHGDLGLIARRPYPQDHVAETALINSLLDDLYAAFPTITHLRKDQSP